MKYSNLLLFAGCITLAGCPSLDLTVQTDKDLYGVNDVVTTTVKNNSDATLYINSCNPWTLYKNIGDVEVVVGDDVVCIHNNARPIAAGESFNNQFPVAAAGLYRVAYEYASQCEENMPFSAENCDLVSESTSGYFHVIEACTEEYAPVCALTQANDEQDRRYQTYSNECFALLEGADLVFAAACGAIEGQSPLPKPDEPLICTTEYSPVCGVSGTEVDVYSNACVAEGEGALVVDDAICEL